MSTGFPNKDGFRRDGENKVNAKNLKDQVVKEIDNNGNQLKEISWKSMLIRK